MHLKRRPRILDVTCGGRMMWFDKARPDVVYGDLRVCEVTLSDGRRFVVKPDVRLDFRCLPFGDDVFDLVLFDPPHLKNPGPASWLRAKYGRLGPHWKDDIRRGFRECWRVLRTGGFFVFKWSSVQVSQGEVLALAPAPPLFGHSSTKTTHWYVFSKSKPDQATPFRQDVLPFSNILPVYSGLNPDTNEEVGHGRTGMSSGLETAPRQGPNADRADQDVSADSA